MPDRSSRRGFTLIELLIVIALISILSIVVVLALNPAEMLRQSRDSRRVSDMTALNLAISAYASSQPASSLGSSSVVYVSIPDPNATTTAGTNCSSLNLPILPSSYTYHCAAPSTYHNIDGTGWIPINFPTLSSNPLISSLPTDPVNATSSRMYYSYATDGIHFEVTSAMESAKYELGGQGDQVSSDSGTLASLYEKGTKFGLEPLDYGDNSLVGYWPLDEGTGSTAQDMSGKGHVGTWNGTMPNGSYYAPGKVGSYEGAFTNTNSDYISIPDASDLDPATAFTATAWVNFTAPTGWNTVFGKESWAAGTGWSLINSDATKWSLIYYKGSGPYLMSGNNTLGVWHFASIVNANGSAKLYIDGALTTSGAIPISNNTLNLYIGARHNNDGTGSTDMWNGFIDDVRMYNRALSLAEIQALYKEGK